MLAKLLPKRILLFFIQKIRKYPIEDSINLYLVFKLLARNDLLFVNNLSEEDREKAFVFKHFNTLEEAFEAIKIKHKNKRMTVNIMTLGGSTFPKIMK